MASWFLPAWQPEFFIFYFTIYTHMKRCVFLKPHFGYAVWLYSLTVLGGNCVSTSRAWNCVCFRKKNCGEWLELSWECKNSPKRMYIFQFYCNIERTFLTTASFIIHKLVTKCPIKMPLKVICLKRASVRYRVALNSRLNL